MKISLRHKIIAVNLIVLFLAFAIVSLVVIERLGTVNINMLVENLKYQAELSVISIRQNLLTGSSMSDIDKSFSAQASEFAVKLSNEYRIRVDVFSSDRQLIAGSGPSAGSNPEFNELPEVFNGNRTYTIRTIQGERYLYFCFPVVYQRVIGAVMFTYPLKNMDAMTRNIQFFLLAAFLVGLLVIISVSVFLSVRITKPLLLLKESALKLSNGNFKEKINIRSSDEAGELARAFNTMSHEIESRINIINLEKAKLDSILKSMGEGVLAMDADNKLLMCNDIAQGLLTPELEAKIFKLSEKIRQTNTRTIIEFENGSRVFHICATPLKQNREVEGIVVILNDITELRLLQEKQKQFVTNVSHELKTPLTTILGYVDLLKEKGGSKEIFDTSLSYLQGASDRLLRLVNDLIDLSVLKRSEFEIEPKSTNITCLVNEVVGQMALKAQKFNISLITNLPETSEINVDPVRIKQAFVNILDNAIKYSQGGNISIELSEENTHIALAVSDNGCGIPENMLANIFEPFCRVDKSRSRDIGGNGLGLSITKEIIEKHSGTVMIESTVGKGTTVRITLPKVNI